MTNEKPAPAFSWNIKTFQLPLLSGGILCLFVALLWWTLTQQEKKNIQDKVQDEASYLISHVNADLRNRVPAIQRMVKRWEFRGGTPKDEFMKDAEAYYSDAPGYQALEWMDNNYYVRWVVPLKGNERVVNLHHYGQEKRRVALENARRTGRETMTAPIDLVQGGKGFLVYFPITIHGEFDGFILAVFRIQEWLTHIFNIEEHHPFHKDSLVQLFLDGEVVYSQKGWEGLARTGLEEKASTRIMGHDFTLHVRPSKAFIEQRMTLLPRLSAVFGLVLSLLVAVIVYLLQKTSMEKQAAQSAHDAMKADRKNLQAIFESSPIGMLVVDENIDIVMVNGVAREIAEGQSQAPPHRPRPGDIIECIHRSKSPQGCGYSTDCSLCPLRTAITSVMRNGISLRQVELAVDVIRNGQPKRIWIMVGAEPFIIDEKRMVVVALHDITDQKLSDEALKRSEAQVRLLLNSTGEAIYGIDLQGDCTFANPACLRMIGYSRLEHILGVNMHELIHHSYPMGQKMPVESCRIYKSFRDGLEVHVDDEVLWKADGSSFPVEYWSYPQIVNGTICGAVVTFIDISERRRTEAMLAAERKRLSAIIEGTNVGTWEWNVQTGETVFNDRWAEIIGFTLAELAPVNIKTWIEFAHPEDLQESNEKLRAHFQKEAPYYEMESRMRHKNGGWIWVLDRGKVASWTDEGKPLMMYGTHQDITSRKRAEEQLEQLNQTLQERVAETVSELRKKDQVLIQQSRLAAMGEMIGNIAHQWRQPLNALSMLISNLHYCHMEGELTEAAMNESAATANRLIQKMSSTINDFRNFFSPDKEMVEFSALHQIRQAVLLVETAFKNSDIGIFLNETTDCTLTGYPNEYSQALLNLLTNAREAIAECGVLPGRITVDIQQHEGMGVVTVQDNGGGIPDQILERIFEPYFTTKQTGTGIGLYMSKMIIEHNMHGRITARNIQEGSEFTISIPIAEKTS